MNKISGSCLCGDVKFTCVDDFASFHLCHCVQCQKTTGAAHVANLFTKPDNLKWLQGEDKVKRFDAPGRTISVAFCETCGSPVPYLSTSDKAVIVPAGSLDGTPNIAPTDHIFWHERASWYEAGITAKKFDGFPE